QGGQEQARVARSLDRQARVGLGRGDLVGDQYQRQTAATRAGGVSAAHVEHVVVEAVPDLPQPRRAGDRLDCRYECGVLDVVLLTTQDADVRADGGHAGGPAVELGWIGDRRELPPQRQIGPVHQALDDVLGLVRLQRPGEHHLVALRQELVGGDKHATSAGEGRRRGRHAGTGEADLLVVRVLEQVDDPEEGTGHVQAQGYHDLPGRGREQPQSAPPDLTGPPVPAYGCGVDGLAGHDRRTLDRKSVV